MKKPDNYRDWVGRRVRMDFGGEAGKIVCLGIPPDNAPYVLFDAPAKRCVHSGNGGWLIDWSWLEPEPTIPLHPLDALDCAQREQVMRDYKWHINYKPLAGDSKMSNEKWGSECDELRRFNDAEMEVLKDNPDALAFLRVLTYTESGNIREGHPVWQKFLRRMAMADKELIANCHEYIKKVEKDTSK